MTAEPPRPTPRGDAEPSGSTPRPGGQDSGQGGPPANWALVFDLGLRLGISVIIGVGAGVLVDGWLGTSPLFTLVGTALGFGAAMYGIWDVAKHAMRR